MAKEIISESADQTQKIATKLLKDLTGGEILALVGELGSGKTCFVQGLAKALGIRDQITSPSFVLIKEYQIKNLKSQISNLKTKKFKKLIHIDLYRLKKIDKILKQGISEYFQPENVVIIEWAEKLKKALPDQTLWIKFIWLDENCRKIIFK